MQNSYFPASYQPMMPQYQQPQAGQPANSGIVWVQGLEGAKAYPVGAGNNVLLMDSETSVFYIKSTDPSGMPQPLRVFDYKERTAQQAAPDTSEFVTRDELEKKLADLTKKGKKKDE